MTVVDTAGPVTGPAPRRRGALGSLATGTLGGIGGLAPHVLHHVGPLVGTALVAGGSGTAIFGALGFVASVPMLLRLRRRFASWWAPGIALAAFAAMFAFSSFVIGPLVSGSSPAPVQEAPAHESHHG